MEWASWKKKVVTFLDDTKSNKFSFISFYPHTERYDFGTPLPSAQGTKSETCNYIIHSKNRKSGEVMTPTYPGTYPKDIHCSYKFVGKIRHN